jgi:NAD(P)H-dependent flavin oxidoreductase YrpB (nitropropane dioxygenase family)
VLALLDQVLEAVAVPVVAAGGVGSARGMAAALAAGADAVRVGTRFVAAAESGAHRVYVQALLGAEAADTVVTGAFSVMWPGAPHRVLRSSLEEAVRVGEDELVGEIEIGGRAVPLPRFAVPSPTTTTSGRIEAMPHYAGESVGSVREVAPAAEIVRELAEGAERLLRRWGAESS